MAKGGWREVVSLLGKKLGMSQVFVEDGRIAPVTVLEMGPCTVLQVKVPEKDGYSALQVGFEDKKKSRVTKPEQGIAKKAKTMPKRFVREIPVPSEAEPAPGDQLTVKLFEGVDRVDVVGISKGKGFQGVMKRYGFKGFPASHGTDRKHRAPGSLGASATPSRVVKGKKRSGHMGNVRRTVKNLEVVRVDEERNLLLVKGAVPGPSGGYVIVKESSRRGNK